MVGLAKDIPIHYAVLEEKHVGRSMLDGSFVRLSVKGAEVRSRASRHAGQRVLQRDTEGGLYSGNGRGAGTSAGAGL
jgi:hypothetical protein